MNSAQCRGGWLEGVLEPDWLECLSLPTLQMPRTKHDRLLDSQSKAILLTDSLFAQYRIKPGEVRYYRKRTGK